MKIIVLPYKTFEVHILSGAIDGSIRVEISERRIGVAVIIFGDAQIPGPYAAAPIGGNERQMIRPLDTRINRLVDSL